MAETPTDPDPVLVQLVAWATREGLSRKAVAQRLGVAPATVTGWFLPLEAADRGEPAPASARGFQYANQRSDIQASIAAVLDKPAAALLAESTGSTAFEHGIRDLINSLVLGNDPWGTPGSQRHRVAEAAETVEEVAATCVLPVYQDADQTVVHQFQVAVLVEPEVNKKRFEVIMNAINRRITDAGLDCYWEYGAAQPQVRIRSFERRLQFLGSLAVPVLDGVRSPTSGLLTSASSNLAQQEFLRRGVVVSAPYGGSRPIAGLLAQASGAGHIPAEPWMRRLRAQQRRAELSGGALRHVREDSAVDAGFALHKLLFQLQSGDVPGAWWLSMEASSPAGYGPLDTALTQLRGVIVVVRLGPLWHRLAGWRLAGADIDQQINRSRPGRRRAAITDVEPFTGASTDRGIQAFRIHERLAAQYRTALEGQDQYLQHLVARRREAGLPIVELVLDAIGDDLPCVRLVDDAYEQVRGADRLLDLVAFADVVGPMTHEWSRLAADLCARIDDVNHLTLGLRSAH